MQHGKCLSKHLAKVGTYFTQSYEGGAFLSTVLQMRKKRRSDGYMKSSSRSPNRGGGTIIWTPDPLCAELYFLFVFLELYF